ncbi:MAG TPA: GTP-binding protein, partial [Armatimonadota bacterium]|nr:GTP-binding protein [Armatimonadota bacterium]
VEKNVVSLANGCICCTIRDDLVETVMATINRPERPEYILLEASGVAEPSGIAMAFNNPDLHDCIRLDSILCVVDAEQIFAAPEFMELKIFQMACADMIILNKVDLVDSGRISEIESWLDSRLNRIRLIEASHCDVPIEVLLSVGRLGPVGMELIQHDSDGSGRYDHTHQNHARLFSTWSYTTDKAFSLVALRKAAARLPVNIYRAKGIIYTSDIPEQRAILQVVGRRVDISLADEWGDRTPQTRIVAIGAAEGMDEEALRTQFEQCIDLAIAGS